MFTFKTKIFHYISASIFFSALLMGCSNEPRDEEIVRLITNDLKADAASLIDKKVFGVNFGSVLGIDQLKINAVEKIACEPIVSKKITCQVFADSEFVKKNGLTELLGEPRTKKIVEYQFVKTGQGWQVLELVEKK